jgi:SAM-dependent methyltransferase
VPLPDEREDTLRRRTVLQEEFDRTAAAFAERTKGRFDALDPVAFSQVSPGAVVAEVGAGTGNFLSHFGEGSRRLIAVDLTAGMLVEARKGNGGIEAIQGDGAHLPLRSRSVDLVMSAQALHHIWQPVPVLKEMRRVMKEDGRLLLVDQVATERYEEIAFMNELEALRDPSHATSRPPSAFRIIVAQAGLEIVDELVVEVENRFSQWMWPGEFPEERIAKVESFIEDFGAETGMDFVMKDGEFHFTRRRIMILARRV